MDHLWLFSYLASFILLFTLLVMKFQKRNQFANPRERGLFAVQAAFCFDILINFIYRYMGINLQFLDPVYRRLPYMLIMASHFLLFFALLLFLMALLKIRITLLKASAAVLVSMVLYVYDQIYPLYDRGIHPWYSPADYLFYLAVLACTLLYLKERRERKVWIFLVLLPFVINEQLHFFPLSMHFLPLTAVLLALGISQELKNKKKTLTLDPAGLNDETASGLGLSRRERDIVDCLLLGLDNNAIGEKLFISLSTVKTHLSRIYRKAGVSSRLELVQLINSGNRSSSEDS